MTEREQADDYDLRQIDGTLLRLKRRQGESDEQYESRRAEQKDGRTRLFKPDDYEVIEQPDWTAEDDRQVLIGRIAEQIEGMPIDQLERVLSAAKAVARPGDRIPLFGDTLPSALHEVLSHIEGRSVAEISQAMGDSKWWDRLSLWVDDKRAGR